MDFRKFCASLGLAALCGSSRSLAAQSSLATVTSQPATCEVHVWQSKLFTSDNGNAVGGIIGALVESAVDAGAPPKLVTEQLAQNLGDEKLATLLKNFDWSHYVGTRSTAVTMESSAIDEKSMRALERSQARNSSSTADCQIELYVGKQTFQGGMKTWLFSKFGIRVFDAGKYYGNHGLEITHVRHFPAKNAEQYPVAIEEIKSGFARNLARFLGKSFAADTQ